MGAKGGLTMYCDYCRHLNHTFGNYWCGKGQTLMMKPSINTDAQYPCSFFENAMTYVLTKSTDNVVRTFNIDNALQYLKDSDIIVKASRLAESILMDWSKEEQIELAKEVASITHKLLSNEDEPTTTRLP